MQTFMIPGTIFMSLLVGALFGVVRGILLVVFNATAGASSCFFLSKLIGRPIVSWLWPDKLRFFQAEIDTPVNFLPFPSLNYAGKSLSIVLAPTVVIQGTPLWRNGPPEKTVLCNACGSRWRTKGTLANYTPLHARAETGNEDQRVSRVMSLSLNKKKEMKLVKRKMGQTDNAVSGGLAPDYNRGFQKVVDEDTHNRSTTVATTTSVLISLYTLLVCMVII